MAMWRQFSAWIGGVGIIVLFLAVLPRLRIGDRQALFKTEMAGPELPLADTIRQTARRFLLLYVAITALEALVLAGLGWTGVDSRMDPFNAVAHAFHHRHRGVLSPVALHRALRRSHARWSSPSSCTSGGSRSSRSWCSSLRATGARKRQETSGALV